MEELQRIIKEIMRIASEEGLDVSPDCILEASEKIYVSGNINTQNSSKVSVKALEPCTDKQKWTLKQMGYTDDKIETITKLEAIQLIRRAKGE